MKTMKWCFIVKCLINDGDAWDEPANNGFDIVGTFPTAAEAGEAIAKRCQFMLDHYADDEVVYADERTAIIIHGGIEQDTPNLMYLVKPKLVEVPE